MPRVSSRIIASRMRVRDTLKRLASLVLAEAGARADARGKNA